MLLLLHDTLTDQSDDFFQNSALAIENIAISAIEGKHILIGNRELLNRIAQFPFISRLSSASIMKCKQQLPEYARLQHLASDFIQISHDCHAHVTVSNNQRIINLPIKSFNDSSIIQETILLGENLIDSTFFEIVAETFAFINKFGSLKLRSEKRLGGGSTTPEVYKHIQDGNNRFCLCIIDSDKMYPLSNPGIIANKIQDIDDDNRPISRCIFLSCREAENMLSCKQLQLPLSCNDVRYNALERFTIIEQCNPEARFYIDIKQGLRFKDVFKFTKDHPFRQFWITCITDICRQNGIRYSCLDSDDCFWEDDNCECTIMPGFGDDILEQVLDKLKYYSANKVSEMISGPVNDEWDRIGQIVFSWCLGRDRRPVL